MPISDEALSGLGAIRDTDAHNSDGCDNRGGGTNLFAVVNTLNQAVTVQFQGSVDGSTWVNIGESESVAASTGTKAKRLTDPWPQVRAQATCSVAPTSGTLVVFRAWEGE